MEPGMIGVQRLDDDVSTAGQLAPEALAGVRAAGFRSIVNNRPDLEGGPQQPTDAQMRAAAEAAGLEYAFLPVISGSLTPADVERFADLVRTLPKPVLAFCRSGARSGNLWRLAKAHGAL
jgi:uncharacterized protein (TIGR01244 family)